MNLPKNMPATGNTQTAPGLQTGTLLQYAKDDVLLLRCEVVERLRITSATFTRWRAEKKVPPPDLAPPRKGQQWRLSTLHSAGLRV